MHTLVKWLATYWTVIVVSVVLSVLLNQAASLWLIAGGRGRDDRRRRESVFRELRGRLRTHCETLRPVLINPSVDVDRWQLLNDELMARAKHADVVWALGPSYDAFLAAVASESRAITAQRRNEAVAERGRFARLTVENVADVLIAYAPFIRIAGDPKASRDIEAMARRSYRSVAESS